MVTCTCTCTHLVRSNVHVHVLSRYFYGRVSSVPCSLMSRVKRALMSLTKTMPLDYAVDGIQVNAISPAVVRTPMLQRWAAGQEYEAGITSYPFIAYTP